MEESIQKAETNPISQAIPWEQRDFWEGRFSSQATPVGVRSRKVGHETNIDLVVDLDRYDLIFLEEFGGVGGQGFDLVNNFLEPGTLMIEVITPTGWAKKTGFFKG